MKVFIYRRLENKEIQIFLIAANSLSEAKGVLIQLQERLQVEEGFSPMNRFDSDSYECVEGIYTIETTPCILYNIRAGWGKKK